VNFCVCGLGKRLAQLIFERLSNIDKQKKLFAASDIIIKYREDAYGKGAWEYERQEKGRKGQGIRFGARQPTNRKSGRRKTG
jgi:hypothetical protein